MKTFKTTLLIALLLFSANALMAQDKYEYASIIYVPANKYLTVSSSETGYNIIAVPKGAAKDEYDVTAALNQIKLMNIEGWEIYDTGVDGFKYLYHLRKKVS